MKPSQFRFFQKFLEGFFESMYVHGIINSIDHTRLRNWCRTGEAKGYARKLFHDGTVDMAEYLLRLQLRRLREMDGEEFDHIQVIFISEKERPKARCFVGHRFVSPVSKTLRWNLRQILDPLLSLAPLFSEACALKDSQWRFDGFGAALLHAEGARTILALLWPLLIAKSLSLQEELWLRFPAGTPAN